MNKYYILVILFSLVLGGCATQPPAPDQLKVAEKERLYDQNLSEPDQIRSIPVRITRDSGMQGVLATVFLKIDGKYVIWLNASEEVTIYLAEDGYVFELVHALCPAEPACNIPTDVTIKRGFDNNFRIKIDGGLSLIRSKT